jgi:hypothetical protein
MDKTIAIILSASVILIAGLLLVFMGSSSILDFGNDANRSSTNTQCQFQAEQLADGDIEADQVDDQCKNNPEVQAQLIAQNPSIQGTLCPSCSPTP